MNHTLPVFPIVLACWFLAVDGLFLFPVQVKDGLVSVTLAIQFFSLRLEVLNLWFRKDWDF